MLEHSVYSVISPEGCASILWRDAGRASEAAEAMKITAQDLLGFGIVDDVVPEPPGGAHVDHEALFRAVDGLLERQLRELQGLSREALLTARYQKFRGMGRLGREFLEQTP
jgi:acetyl-CoA carboxylase carboxyl transferase subunit alpha